MGARALCVLPLAFFCAHAATYLRRGEGVEILWCCTVANLLVGAALLLGAARLNAIGVSWLVFGDGLWLIGLLAGAPLLATSLLTHLGGLLVGLLAVRRLGWPRRTPLWALGALMGLQLVSRLATPAARNINLAFAIPAGFEGWYPSYPVYYATMLPLTLAAFYLTERLCASS